MTENGLAVDSTSSSTNGAPAADLPKPDADIVDSIEGRAAAPKNNDDAVARNSEAATNGHATAANDDSEAETDIEPGNEAGPRTMSRRSIKHEAKDDAAKINHDKTNGVSNGKAKRDSDDLEQQDKPPGENSNSSILTSAVSSPSALDDQSSQADSSDSPQSPSKTSVDSDTLARGTGKRKRENDESQGVGNKRRIKRESSTGPERSTSKKQRSSSPPTRHRRRTLSTQLALLDRPQKSGRRKPASTQTAQDEPDASSDDSQTHHSHRQRKTSQALHNQSYTKARIAPTINTMRYRDKSGRTLFAKACAQGDMEKVKQCLEENPSHLNEPENAGNTPLQIASLGGDAEIIKFLIQKGADIHTQNIDKDTPLIDAVENGYFEVVALLLDAGVNPFQANSRGHEPFELNQEALDNPPDKADKETIEDRRKIRRALLDAKEKWNTRRPSESGDHQPSRESAALRSPRGSPSIATLSRQNTNAASRRAPRGASSRNDLLWIEPTPERLHKAAGEGDVEAVNQLLGMQVSVNSQAVLAAAKGCHQECLDMLLALGQPEVDPNPLPGTTEGRGTPLLAAIGQSGQNIGILKTLLNQAGFDPTRRLVENKTYYQLAKDRAGPNADVEYDVLKTAYDNFLRKGGSPKTQRISGSSKRQKRPEAVSPKATKQEAQESRKETGGTSKRPGDAYHRRKGSNERPSSSNSHSQSRSKLKSRESSVAVSERAESPTKRDSKRQKIASDSDDDVTVSTKPRRRLLTAKEHREGEERKRRSSITSIDSTASNLKRGTHDTRTTKAHSSPSPSREKVPWSHKKEPESAKSTKGTARAVRTPKPDAEAISGTGKSSTTDGSRNSEHAIKAKRKDRPADAVANKSGQSASKPAATNTSAQAAEKEPKKSAQEQSDEQIQMEQEAKKDKLRAAELLERKAEAERAETARLESERKRKEVEEAQERAARQQYLESESQRLPEVFYKCLHENSVPPTEDDLVIHRFMGHPKSKYKGTVVETVSWRDIKGTDTRHLEQYLLPARSCAPEDDARWMLNFQAAICLGLKEKEWSLTDDFRGCPAIDVPKYLQVAVVRWFSDYITIRGKKEEHEAYQGRVRSNFKKVSRMFEDGSAPLFFIRCEDFQNALQKRPELAHVLEATGELKKLRTCGLSLAGAPQPNTVIQARLIT